MGHSSFRTDVSRGNSNSAANTIRSTGPLHYRVATIQFRPQNISAHYALVLEGSQQYHGNDIAALARKLNQSSLPQGGRYYVAFSGFTPHRARNMAANLRLQQDLINPYISIQPITGKSVWHGALIAPSVKSLGAESVRPSKSRAGGFEGTLEIRQQTASRIRHVHLKVWAKSRAVITRFFAAVRSKFAERSADKRTSVVEIVNAARADLKGRLKLDNNALRTTIVDQTGRTFIVLLFSEEHAV